MSSEMPSSDSIKKDGALPAFVETNTTLTLTGGAGIDKLDNGLSIDVDLR